MSILTLAGLARAKIVLVTGGSEEATRVKVGRIEEMATVWGVHTSFPKQKVEAWAMLRSHPTREMFLFDNDLAACKAAQQAGIPAIQVRFGD